MDCSLQDLICGTWATGLGERRMIGEKTLSMTAERRNAVLLSLPALLVALLSVASQAKSDAFECPSQSPCTLRAELSSNVTPHLRVGKDIDLGSLVDFGLHPGLCVGFDCDLRHRRPIGLVQLILLLHNAHSFHEESKSHERGE